MVRTHPVHSAHPHADRPSIRITHLHRRIRAWILPRSLGHHPRMLDVLHESNTTVVCGVGAWHGGGRILEGGIVSEDVDEPRSIYSKKQFVIHLTNHQQSRRDQMIVDSIGLIKTNPEGVSYFFQLDRCSRKQNQYRRGKKRNFIQILLTRGKIVL